MRQIPHFSLRGTRSLRASNSSHARDQHETYASRLRRLANKFAVSQEAHPSQLSLGIESLEPRTVPAFTIVTDSEFSLKLANNGNGISDVVQFRLVNNQYQAWLDGKYVDIKLAPTTTTSIPASPTTVFVDASAATGKSIVDLSGLVVTTSSVLGSQFDDILVGQSGGDSIDGSAGDDTILGLLGKDTLEGGAGADVIDGGGDVDSLLSAVGDDTLNGGFGLDQLTVNMTGSKFAAKPTVVGIELTIVYGTSASDEIDVSGLNNVLVLANDGDDTVIGSAGNDTIYGQSGRDSITAGAGNDLVFGDVPREALIGQGNVPTFPADIIAQSGDVINGEAGNDTLDGGIGDDTASGGDGADVLLGSLHTDLLQGDGGNDTMEGHEGGDTFQDVSSGTNLARTTSGGVALVKGPAAITITGNTITHGAGSLVVESTGKSTFVVKVVGAPSPTGTLLDAKSSAFSVLVQTGSGNDTIFGSQLADTINAGEGLDYVDGQAGNDTIIEPSESASFGDTVFGGAGDDTIESLNADYLYGGDGNDVIKVGQGGLAFGEAGNDLLTDGPPAGKVSSPDDSYLDGGSGDDTIIIYQGRDTVEGREGNDVLISNANDRANLPTLIGGDGDDAIYGAGLVDAGFGNDVISGSGFDDSINAGAGDDLILSRFGNDVIDASFGNDTIYAGGGDDLVFAGFGNDLVIADLEGFSDKGVAIFQSGKDTVFGEGGDDLIFGNDGDDSLIAGDGIDTLYGQAGIDTLVFETGDTAIQEFSNGGGNIGGGGDAPHPSNPTMPI